MTERPGREIAGARDGAGLRFALVVGQFEREIADHLVSGAMGALVEHGVSSDDIEVIRVPGAWEVPLACARVLERGGVDGILGLGCVIRGETAHFDFIAGEASRGLAALGRDSSIPVSFGILTTENREQALARARPERGDKGAEVALAALEMVNLYRELR